MGQAGTMRLKLQLVPGSLVAGNVLFHWRMTVLLSLVFGGYRFPRWGHLRIHLLFEL